MFPAESRACSSQGLDGPNCRSSFSVRFIFGLGASQIVDSLAHQAGSPGYVLDLIINGIIAGVFVLFWNFARQGQKWAWYVGMAVYAVDGVLLLLFKDYLAIAFHAYALYRMSSGLKLLPMLERLDQQSATGAIDRKSVVEGKRARKGCRRNN